jgi:iron(II)-dependent oxidoreductase
MTERSPASVSMIGPASESDNVVDEMLEQGRYALLLRPQIARQLDARQRLRAHRHLSSGMTWVPAGGVKLHGWCPEKLVEFLGPQPVRRVCVEPLYLDRYAVTNADFQRFLADGGYCQESLWDPAVWNRVREFVDETGHPGPSGWSEGRYANGLDKHPVVGISWFEAEAYACWVGKRLPTDAEWVKAACWPVEVEGEELLQRKYPWGDSMEPLNANLWSNGRRSTVAVDEFAGGVSVGGACQLVGNVWEWTASRLTATAEGRPIRWSDSLKILRGGSFDTYFENQAACQFQSADSPFARRDNIGFRCAIGACDIMASTEEAATAEAAHVQSEPRKVE